MPEAAGDRRRPAEVAGGRLQRLPEAAGGHTRGRQRPPDAAGGRRRPREAAGGRWRHRRPPEAAAGAAFTRFAQMDVKVDGVYMLLRCDL